MPRAKRARESFRLLIELPRITGTIAEPLLEPVSSPASAASSRKSLAFACSCATRCGCFSKDGARRAPPGGGRRQADAIHESLHGVLQPADERVRAGDVAAAAAEGLGERAHPDVDIGRIHAEVLANATAAWAHDADRMGLVHHEERFVPLGQA